MADTSAGYELLKELSTAGLYDYSTTEGIWYDYNASVTMRIIYTLVGIIGIIDNAFVIFVILMAKHLREKSTNVYILNQSVIDLLGSAILVAFYNSPELEVDNRWLSVAGCKIWSSKIPLWSLLLASTYNLVIMTLERRQDLRNPLGHRKSFSKTKLYLSLIFPYLFGFGFQAGTNIPPTNIINNSCVFFWKNYLTGKIVGFLVIFVEWLIPIFILIFSYTSIICMLYKQLTHSVGEKSESRDRIYLRGMRNTIKMLVSVAAMFILCWSPNEFLLLLYHSGLKIDFSSEYYHVTAVLVVANSLVNPIIYCLQYEQFRAAAATIFLGTPRNAHSGATTQVTEMSMTEAPSTNKHVTPGSIQQKF